MNCKIHLTLVLLTTLGCQTAGKLIMKPRDTDAKVNQTSYFNCSTDFGSTAIFWFHGTKYVFTGNGMLEPYHERFKVDQTVWNGTYVYNLIVHSVQPSDAGMYTCWEDEGVREKHSAQLIVLDNDPDCQSNIHPDGLIGQNIFNIPPDDVRLTCSVTYHGKIPPKMEWKRVGDNRSIKNTSTSVATSTNRVTYTLKMTGDIALDNSSYVCQTTRSAQTQYKCTSEIIKVLYFADVNTIEKTVSRGELITCFASNSTFSCTSQWYHDNYTCPLSCDETITTHLLGVYLCTVKCNVRGRDYYFEAMKVFVVEAISSSELGFLPASGRLRVVAVVLIALIVIVIIILTVSTAVLHYKRRKYLQEFVRQSEDNKQLLSAIDDFISLGHSREYGTITEEEIDLVFKVKKNKDATVKEKRIVAAAILGKELFVARVNTPEISSYNLETKSCRTFAVRKLSSAYDMCACVKSNCLYIIDNNKNSANEIMTLITTGKVRKKWLTKENTVGNLSVTTEGNVILAVHHKNTLLEYSPGGKLLCEIKLQEFNHLSHAIKLDIDRFVVCYGTLRGTKPTLSIVKRVGKHKKIEKSFPNGRGAAEIPLHWPSYMAVGKNGCVIVADLFSKRLLLLDSELNVKKKIVPKRKQGFRGPQMIFLNETLLAVVITGGGPSLENNFIGQKGDTEIKDVDDEKKIDEDCELLVFDIKPLLQPLT